MAGNLATLPDACAFLNFDERANLRFVANLAAVQVNEF
jgi:hypothetical protein